MLPAMGRLLAMSICLGLALGCGGEKKQEEAPAKTPAKDEPAPVQPPPPQELTIEFEAPEDSKAPFEDMQNAVRAVDSELRGCFTGTQATKANVNVVVVAATGAVESVSPSADREQAEVCLRKVLGPLQFPTWDGDKAVLKLKLKLAFGDKK